MDLNDKIRSLLEKKKADDCSYQDGDEKTKDVKGKKEVELDERNDENKFKKDLYVAKKGEESLPIDPKAARAFANDPSSNNREQSRKNYLKYIKKAGRSTIKTEETEIDEQQQIDELSKKTHASYIKKAAMDRGSKSVDFHNTIQKNYNSKEGMNNEKIKKALKKVTNRQMGIEKAVDKMNEEDFKVGDQLIDRSLAIGTIESLEEGWVDVLWEGRGYTTRHNLMTELSKNKLGAYVPKAAKSGMDSSPDAQGEVDDFQKEEIEDLEESTTERTSAYRFTHKPGDAKSEKKLADLKKNKAPHERILLKGRLGKNNPHASKYQKGGEHYRPSHRDVKKEHAGHFDVYVHNDWRKMAADEAKADHGKQEKYRKETKKAFAKHIGKSLADHGYNKIGETDHNSVHGKFEPDTGRYHTATVSKHSAHVQFHNNIGGSYSYDGLQGHGGNDTNHAYHLKHMGTKLAANVLKYHEHPHETRITRIQTRMHENFNLQGEDIIEHVEYGFGNILSENDEYIEVAFQSGVVRLENYLSELSDDTLKSYSEKAEKSAKKNHKKSDKHIEKSRVYDDAKAGENIHNRKSERWWKYDKKKTDHYNKSKDLDRKAYNREAGARLASKKSAGHKNPKLLK